MISRTTIKFAAGLFILALLSISVGAMAVAPGGVTSGLGVWLDAQTITQANGSYVYSWADQSGLANDANAPWIDPNWAPTYVTNAINGQSVLRFGLGTNNQLVTASGALTGSTMTAFMVYKNRAPAYGQGMAAFGPSMFMHANGGGSGGTLYQDGNWATPMGSGSFVPNAVFGLNTVAFNGASSLIKMNGSVACSGDMTGYYSGGGLRLGARPNTAGPAPVDIAEVIVYNRALSAAEENSVGAYLESKYGLSTTYQAVPEPGTLSLLALGVIPFLRRRRK
jgi:hypothetical protein